MGSNNSSEFATTLIKFKAKTEDALREALLKKSLEEALGKITYEDVLGEWLDKNTWVCWSVQWKPHLLKLRELFDKLFDLPDDVEADEGKMMIEYHEDEEKIWYGILFEDGVITATDLLSCEYLDKLVLRVKNETK